jgi:hypothetical protein
MRPFRALLVLVTALGACAGTGRVCLSADDDSRCEAERDASTSQPADSSDGATSVDATTVPTDSQAPDRSDSGTPPEAGTDASASSCENNADCGPDAPACTAGRCSGCSASSDCISSASVGRGICAQPSGACVECTRDTDCPTPTKPMCGAEHTCEVGCLSDLDCERDAPGWDTTYCELGKKTCVQCIPGALELEQCVNGKACDLTQMTCSGQLRGSVQPCRPCTTDTECAAGLYCVKTEASKASHQRYCVLRRDSGPCPAQYSYPRNSVSSLGVSARFCFPDEQLTTCEALLKFTDVCSNDAQCGPTGLCRGPQDAKRCTYVCDGAADCSTTCTGIEPSYCDPN